jgi:hypothetical protein
MLKEATITLLVGCSVLSIMPFVRIVPGGFFLSAVLI